MAAKTNWQNGDVVTADALNALGQTANAAPASVDVKTLFQPMTGLYPASDVTTNTLNDVAPTGYTNAWGTLWNSANLNKQGQNWSEVDTVNHNVAAGCYNKTTDRLVTGNPIPSLFDFSFQISHSRFDLMWQTFGYADFQIYADYNGQMMRLNDTPKTITKDGYSYYHVVFATERVRRIRVIGTACYFVQVLHEQSTVVNRGPTLPLFIADGDSYFESSTSLNSGSARSSFVTYGMIDAIIEATGWACWRAGEGGSGYFNNGSTADSATPGTNGTTRWFSTQRMGMLTASPGPLSGLPVGQRPLLMLVNGSINDGNLSGGTAAMTARCLAGWDLVKAADPLCSIVQIGPEPLDPVSVGDVHDLNRTGQINAVAAHSSAVGYIDPRNIAGDIWWTGTGSDLTPTTTASQQAALIGHDGVHPNYFGHQLYGRRIVDALGNLRIPAMRAYGIA